MPSGLSLHIGLNSVSPDSYAGWSGPLIACEADARDMATIAQQQRFSPTILLTQSATRGAVLAHIQDAAGRLQAGDIFLLTNSSHGGQVPDINGDEADGLDETWCLYDGQLIDDELYAACTQFAAGVRIVIVSDSCHSGTVAKTAAMQAVYGDVFRYHLALSGSLGALGVRPASSEEIIAASRARAMPPEIAQRTYLANKDFYDSLNTPEIKGAREAVSALGILLSGCQDNQLSMDGTFNGAFTGMLKQIWNGGRYAGGYRSFLAAIRQKLEPTQSPNFYPFGTSDGAFFDQHPFSI